MLINDLAQYLSPERAKGLPHDTRKSDVWALGMFSRSPLCRNMELILLPGVTFFEILEGRTPFEAAEGETFATKEDLEKYWGRTVKGRWVGDWKRVGRGKSDRLFAQCH